MSARLSNRKLDGVDKASSVYEKKKPKLPHPRHGSNVHGPSEHWKRDASMPSRKLEEIASSANWGYLIAEAEVHHPADVTCTVDLSRWTRGAFNAVFELAFSDGSFWVARVSLWEEDDKTTEVKMLSELATMKIVSGRTSIPVPTVYAYALDKKNSFGFPYILMSALPGRVLDDKFASSVPKTLQPKIAEQLARYIRELSLITFDEIGRGLDLKEPPQIISFPGWTEDIGPFNSSGAYFSAIQRQANLRIRRLHLDDENWPNWATSCDLFTKATPMLICQQFRRGPFPLYHGDLHANNILVDDEYIITGVLDWTGARTVPVEQFVTYVDLMTYPMLSDEENQPIVDFRKLFISAYRQLENEPASQHGDKAVSLSHIFASPLPEAVYRWNIGVPASLKRAMNVGLYLVRMLYGNETTLENYEARKKKGFGQQFRLRCSKPSANPEKHQVASS